MSIQSKINMVKFYYKRNGFIKTFKKVKYKVLHISSNRKRYQKQNEDYQLWIKNNEPTEYELEEQRNKRFDYNPLISIVVPMYNTKEKFLEELIDSVLHQTYTNWELCLADGSPEKKEYVDKYVTKSEKIKYKLLDDNKGISGNTNRAIEMATGDYIALLDHDDLLPLFSLYEIVDAINKNKDADFIYTDEDKIFNGKRIEPHFKTDYAPDMLMSYNYICHFAVYRKDLIKKIGLLDSNFDGSQDYDFILRATENANRILHIPKILYNWRMNEDSVALNSSAKPYAYEAAKRAIKAHLERIGVDADVEDSETAGIYKVKYKVVGNPKVSVVIVCDGSVQNLNKCIKSVFKKAGYNNFEVIIIDADKSDKVSKYCKKIKKDNIKVLPKKEKDYSYTELLDSGINISEGEYVVFLDKNIKIISDNWLKTMLGNCQRNDVGIVGAKVLYKNSKIKHVGVVFNSTGIPINVNKNTNANESGYMARNNIIQNYTAVDGDIMMIRKKDYEEINGVDKKLEKECYSIDLCLKIKEHGKYIALNPLVAASKCKENILEERKNIDSNHTESLRKRWLDIYGPYDPFYNSNFRIDIPNFEIRTDKIK